MNISIAQFAGPYKKANEFWGKANIQERRRRKELIKINKEKELYGHRFLIYIFRTVSKKARVMTSEFLMYS